MLLAREKVKHLRFYIYFLIQIWISVAFASPETLTYQGRILKSNGQPLEYNNVSFLFEITSEDGMCTLFREQRNGVNMSNSSGLFDVAIGSGTRQFPDSGAFPSYKLSDSFINGVTHDCYGSGTWTATSSSARLLKVQFHDGTGWQQITPANLIRSVPFAMTSRSSTMLGDKTVNDFVLKSNAPGSACTAGQVVSWDGTNFSCVTDAGGSGVISDVLAGTGIAVSGTTSKTIAVTFGTTAGTVAQGNDSRIANALQSSTVFAGDVSGTATSMLVDKIKGVSVDSTAPTTGQVLRYDGAKWAAATPNAGTVTSVGVSVPSFLSASGGPITSSGTISISLASQTGNTVFAAPNGSSGAPTFRTLGIADIFSSIGGLSFLNTTPSCAAGSALTYISATDRIQCASIAVDTANIADSAITTAKIADGAVTAAKLGSDVGAWGTSSGNVYRTTGNVGVGTAAPTFLLSVEKTYNPINADNNLNSNVRATANISANQTSYLRAGRARANTVINSGVTQSGYVMGFSSEAFRNDYNTTGDQGTLFNLTGLRVQYGHENQSASSPATTNAYGVSIEPYKMSGSIQTAYDLYLKSTTGSATITTHYGLYVEGASKLNYFAGNVGIGSASPVTSLDLSSKTDAIYFPKGTTAQQPSSPAAGMIRYNTDNNAAEFYNGTSWINLAAITSGGTMTNVSTITGGASGINISAGGTNQNVTLTASGTGTVTTGSVMTITNSTASTAYNNGALVVSGGVGVSGNINSNSNIYAAGNLTAGTALYSPLIYGSTSATGNLTLDSTSNATKGNVLIATSGGNVGVGLTNPYMTFQIRSTTPSTTSHPRGGFQVESESTNIATISSRVSSSNSINPSFRGYRSQGSISVPTAVVANDALSAFEGLGHDGTSWRAGAGIGMFATENWTPTTTGTAMNFSTIANGTSSYGVRMTLTGSGNLGIGTTTPAQRLTVTGGNIALNSVGNVTPSFEWRASDNSSRAYISHDTETLGTTTDENRFFQRYGFKTFYTQNAERLRIDATGNVGINATDPKTKLHVVENTTFGTALTVQTKSGSEPTLAPPPLTKPAGLTVIGGDNNDNTPGMIGIISPGYGSQSLRGPTLHFASSRSTTAQLNSSTFNPVQLGDQIGVISFGGDNGVNLRSYGASIMGIANSTWTSTNTESYLTFSTTPNGSISPVERMKINPSGFVGIGTVNPQTALHVVRSGTGNAAIFDSTSGNGGIRINALVGNSVNVIFSKSGLQRWGWRNGGTAESGSNAGSDFFLDRFDDSGTMIDSPMTVRRSTGSVGFGASSPLSTVDVQYTGATPNSTDGDANNFANKAGLRVATNFGTGGNSLYFGVSDIANSRTSWIQSGHRDPALASSVVDSELSLQPHGGYVGIGTTSPTANLHVYNSSATNGKSVLKVQQAGMFADIPDYAFAFHTYGNRSSLGNGTQHGLYVQAGWSGDANNTEIARFSALTGGYVDVPRMVVKSNGNVGIGTTAPSEFLEVAGNVKATSYLYTSDARLKKEVREIASASEKIQSLRGVEFKWKSNDREDVGFIAQEVEKVFPQLVKTDNVTGYKSVQYGNIVAVLVEAVKDLFNRQDAAEVRIQKLEKQVEVLQKQLEMQSKINDELCKENPARSFCK